MASGNELELALRRAGWSGRGGMAGSLAWAAREALAGGDGLAKFPNTFIQILNSTSTKDCFSNAKKGVFLSSLELHVADYNGSIYSLDRQGFR